MQTLLPLLAGLGLLVGPSSAPLPCEPDLAQLQEVLHDRQDPRGQSQAALLLVQSTDPGAGKIIRQNLDKSENEEPFIALAGAIRLRPDTRFVNELLAAFSSSKPRVRQAAAETLAALPASDLVEKLESLARDIRAEIRVRQLALWTLGRTGRKEAAAVLVEAVASANEETRRVAAGALTDLTGQNLGQDTARWQSWWQRHKDLSAEQWLHMRLSFQTTRAQRLEGELVRARAQVLRLHQQLYSRLPLADRFTHLQALLEQDDPGVRALAVGWCVELLPTSDSEKQRFLGQILLRLTHDSSAEVQRAAVLALGRMNDPLSFQRLEELLRKGSVSVRAMAVRAMAQQARGNTPDARVRLKQVVPHLQRALEDRALEVVVEAAEALGMLGAPEAGPVLIGLLRHPSENVRQTAAQALERTADAGLIEGLVRGLDDPAVMVRFSLVGALGKAASSGATLPGETRKRLLDRLETLLKRDPDAGVRGRAATVLGECGGQEVLATLWQQAESGAEGRVQEKAWEALVEIMTRAGNVGLVEMWDRKLSAAGQGVRRVQLWTRVQARWEQTPTMRESTSRAMLGLVQAHLDLGKWSAATPLVQGLLTRMGESAEVRSRCLKWMAQIAQKALDEGNRAEALRIAVEARAFLDKSDELAATFDQIQERATAK